MMVMFTGLRRYLALLFIGGAIAALTGCGSWQRDDDGMPDVSSIQLQQRGKEWVAVAPDCRRMLQPKRDWRDNDRWRIAFGCATYTNLAASLARPQDLAAPQAYSGMQADAAALSVTRYRENKVEPLRETESTADISD
ncbi:CpaD family pilus assembly lipoprotein [Brenneria populi subsp. brevivirga]|uniref:CpaD family pilus assembly lipoprotein n=1 Tax=Brenneria populi TaxID=1505588 RepID=UPI002E16FB78|nr:CpaD family pilus assembly lipoprotein [Brenneria populi subsp. brevivirga]